jgi:hypothetical protein
MPRKNHIGHLQVTGQIAQRGGLAHHIVGFIVLLRDLALDLVYGGLSTACLAVVIDQHLKQRRAPIAHRLVDKAQQLVPIHAGDRRATRGDLVAQGAVLRRKLADQRVPVAQRGGFFGKAGADLGIAAQQRLEQGSALSSMAARACPTPAPRAWDRRLVWASCWRWVVSAWRYLSRNASSAAILALNCSIEMSPLFA